MPSKQTTRKETYRYEKNHIDGVIAASVWFLRHERHHTQAVRLRQHWQQIC
ncbi:hypothetical protein NEILACOT_05340 [Neisseria lactamica ATCC 23970]|uniref:Uncharacterized protein n=1 Tax=Neisseria lactamica ATCC 23970 TaxID=546265 RepID=D0WCQ6_NEILA|nr:hypothetical protein NEILACOT_05340 [Neisseria lactamica ATCC 23970]